MKKMVRFLSVVMVIIMMFSMTASAFAKTGFVVPGGASSSGSNSSSGTGTGTSVSANTKPSYYTSSTGNTISTTELDVDGTAEAPQYLGNGDLDYEDLTGSDDPNIANNADFIMYIHDNLTDATLLADGTIDTAYAIFGSDVIEGRIEETAEPTPTVDPSTCEHEWVEATCTAAKHCAKCGTTEGESLAHTYADNGAGIQVCTSCGKTECEINGHKWVDNGDGTTTCTVCGVAQGSHVHSYSQATCTEPEMCSCGTVRGDALGHQYQDGVCLRCGAADPNYAAPVVSSETSGQSAVGESSAAVENSAESETLASVETQTVVEETPVTEAATESVAVAESPAAAESSAETVEETVTSESTEQSEQPAAESQEAAAEGLNAQRKVIHAEAISYHSAPVTTTSDYNECLLSMLASGDKVYMTKSFDICNSTQYRITIDLQGKTIYAPTSPAGEPAFVIKNRGGLAAANRSPVTFTNGYIEGNGFYVCENGILNLGGLININGLDIRVQNGNSYAVYVANTGTVVVSQGTDLRCAADDAIYVEAGGQIRMSGGTVTYNGSATDKYAVYNAGTFLFNSTGSDVNNSYGVIQNDSGVAVRNEGTMTMGAGTVIGQTGIAVGTAGTLNIYNGTVTGKGSGDTWLTSGAAVSVLGTNNTVTASGGALRSEKTAAIKLFADETTRYSGSKDQITNITLFSAGIITQEIGESDYRVSKFTVNDIGYASYKEAVEAAQTNKYNATTVTIKMGGSYQMTAADAAASLTATNGAIVIFDGNGYELSAYEGETGITAAGGTVTVQNIIIYGGNTTGKAGVLNNGAYLTVGEGVTIRKFDYGVQTLTGTTYINDVYMPDSVNIGIKADGGKTVVAMITDDCDTPLEAVSFDSLEICSGWFKRAVAKNIPSGKQEAMYKVSNYIDSAQSHLKYIDDDGYYEVLFNDEPTVEIVSAEVLGTYTVDDETYVYLAYDKADATPVIFKFEAGCTQINAVSMNSGKTVYPLFSSSVTDSKGNVTGTSGNVRIADQQILMDLPAGVYDIQFTFANSSTIKGKMFLQVYPRVAEIFEVPNTNAMATLDPATVKEYISSDYILSNYNVADGNNFAVVMSELPMKIAIGSNSYPYESDVTDTTYLEYYVSDTSAIAKIPENSTYPCSYAGNYIFFISYADVNNLAAGQNYIFLDYGESLYDIEKTSDQYAYIYFPFTVTNSSVYISPTSLEWTSVSGTYANFTIKPDVLNSSSVYIDGENVDKAYWTYDEDTYVLSIKSSYLNALDKTSHTLEVITSQGKVGATVNTKVGLMAKNLDYHVYGGAKSLSFVASDKINKDGGVWIGASNPTKLDSSCYVWDSEYGFTLSAAFLNRLSLGTYYISAYVWNGTEYEYSTTSFKVISASQASYNPSTGDSSNIFIWLIVLVLSAVAIVVIVLPRFRKVSATGAEPEQKKKSSHLK